MSAGSTFGDCAAAVAANATRNAAASARTGEIEVTRRCVVHSMACQPARLLHCDCSTDARPSLRRNLSRVSIDARSKRESVAANVMAVFAAILFGASVVAVRIAVRDVPPLTLALLRFVQGSLV